MKKYDDVMIKTALIWADLSKCKRAKVGAVIAKEGRIISIGYNGTPSGYYVNSCEKEVFVCNYCDNILKDTEMYFERCSVCKNDTFSFSIQKKTDHSIVIHAEANAILFAAKQGLALNGTTMYVTHAPCKECSKMIIQSGIKRLVYLNDYYNNGLEFLRNNSIEVEKLNISEKINNGDSVNDN